MTHEQWPDSTKCFSSTSLRGPRGPGIDYAAELENRMPIRQAKVERMEKVGRRESKLGLRNIFGRSKTAKDGHESSNALITSKPSIFRASMAEADQSPQEHHNDSKLPTNFAWKPFPATGEDPEFEQHEYHENVPTKKNRTNSRAGRQQKDPNSSWSLPPLFKAFPQAIRHATLTAAAMSSDAILRNNEKKNNIQTREEKEIATTIEGHENDYLGTEKEKIRKKSKKNFNSPLPSFEWTTKIYILVTSGYLLQYSGDGDFNRLPEKMLRLGPSSAAFATDAIAGRHWVVQVSSVADVDDPQGQEGRSIFSKLSFRLAERRSTSNMLMVFENAEDMEGWLVDLRSEIEKQGGKKKLSETGKPNSAGVTSSLREHTGQRTLIVPDPSRFTSPGTRHGLPTTSPLRELRWNETSTGHTSSDVTGNQSLDDISTTNSIISQDERQLDNLRENTHRLSFISSGQRTFVTSTVSSPDGSPIQDKFDEGALVIHDSCRAEVRVRPNASEIIIRRESMQVGNPFVDDGLSAKGRIRVLPTGATVMDPERVTSPVHFRPTPNFSVPHSSDRRFSYARGTASSAGCSPGPNRDRESSPRRFGRTPPSAVQSAHRLSVVTDQAVTRSIATERLPTSPKSPSFHGVPTMDLDKRRLRSVSRGRASRRDDDDSILHFTPERTSSRQHSINSAFRHGATTPVPSVVNRRSDLASVVLSDVPSNDAHPRAHRTSFLDIGESIAHFTRSLSIDPSVASKRISMGSVFSDKSSRSYEIQDSAVSSNHSSDSSGTVTSAPKPTSGHYLNVEKSPQSSLVNRGSLPQIAVSGPPPAPPPTRALPPIPQKVQIRV